MTIAISPMNRQAASDAMYDKLGADYLCVHPSTLVVPEDRLRKIDPKTIPALADSFREVGQISPIGIKRIPGSPNYRVVYGARRALAMQLLLEEAIAKANDPNKDNDVHRFGSMHALVDRPETDDETCRELEIRENLDRKELTVKERTAHQLQLAACMNGVSMPTRKAMDM